MSWVRSMGIAFLFIMIGYLGVVVGIQAGKHETQTEVDQVREGNRESLAQVNRLAKEAEQRSVSVEEPPSPMAPTPDHDRLLQAFRSTDDKGWRIEYAAEEIKAMSSVAENKDYKKVLEKYVTNELHKQLATFQTVGSRVNPREVLVTTTDRNAYLIELERWNQHNGIWAVTGGNQMKIDPQGTGAFEPAYRTLDISQAPADVQKWADSLLAAQEARQDFLRSGTKTYALLQSTNGSSTDSIEIEEVFAHLGEVFISYQSLEVGTYDNPLLVNDYILLEIDEQAEAGVTFTESFRSPS
ncbi:hypothetical protein [Brevibacillus migulae]|uniref:hypothetical protein n=1 Tax=Brevibacillus migulae TaxID=1644114 RepID=UPI00106E5E4F|nr:hypothetical protein [Brevibacillus migulae]